MTESERKVFYVDVGDMTKKEMQKCLKNIKEEIDKKRV